jgi:hypothetical protein
VSAGGVVLVTSRSFSSGTVDLVGRLERSGLVVVRGPADHDATALGPVLATADAWIAGAAPVTADTSGRPGCGWSPGTESAPTRSTSRRPPGRGSW